MAHIPGLALGCITAAVLTAAASAQGTVIVAVNRTPSSSGFITPFGAFSAGISGVKRELVVQIPAGSTSVTFQLAVPNVPGLAGRTWKIQALTTSNASPAGRAFTNVSRQIIFQ